MLLVTLIQGCSSQAATLDPPDSGDVPEGGAAGDAGGGGGAEDAVAPPDAPPPDSGPASVQVWLSDSTQNLKRQADVAFAPDAPSSAQTIDVDDTRTFQTMDGFGAAMTDSAAWLIYTKLSPQDRDTLMAQIFDPAKGAGFSFVRVPMGASDFHVGGNTTNNCSDSSSGLYSYDDSPPGGSDPNLSHFSIAHDLPYIIPVLKQALAINPDLKLLATPWSPPAWMKTNGKMTNCGNASGFIAADYGPLATYFVKFLNAYKDSGVPIYAITPQNEPGQQSDYPGMNLSAAEETSFIGNHLGPALAAANLHPKVLSFDSNWGNSPFPAAVLGDAAARQHMDGTAFHCYGGGSPAQMGTIHDAHPEKDVYETECSVPTTQFPNTIDLVIRTSRAWSKTVLTWTLATDASGGPKTGGGCKNCLGTVTIDQASHKVTYNPQYFQLSHASKFVVPGARRIDSSPLNDGQGYPQTVAFKNPSGPKVLIVHNASNAAMPLRVRWNLAQSFSYSLVAGAVATFTW